MLESHSWCSTSIGQSPLTQTQSVDALPSISCETTPNIVMSKSSHLLSGDVNPMSYCICIRNKNGYVIASDSRSTVIDEHGNIQSFSDNYPKIVYLPKAEVGVVVAGHNTFNGYDTVTAIRLLEDKLCKHRGNVDVITRQICSELAPHATGSVNLCVAGIQGACPVAYFGDFGAKGITQIVALAQNGIWQSAIEHNCLGMLLSANDGGYDVNIGAMSMPQIIEFAEESVRIYKFVYQVKRNLPPIVGGAVQLLAVNAFGEIIRDDTLKS